MMFHSHWAVSHRRPLYQPSDRKQAAVRTEQKHRQVEKDKMVVKPHEKQTYLDCMSITSADWLSVQRGPLVGARQGELCSMGGVEQNIVEHSRVE
jgi:hypothetical protein